MLSQVFFRRVSGLMLGGLLFSLCWACSAPGEELIETVPYSWDRPTYGTPVVYYVLEREKTLGDEVVEVKEFGDIPEESFPVEMEFGFTYRVRVAGVDSEGRQGPWSFWSEVDFPKEKVPDLSVD